MFHGREKKAPLKTKKKTLADIKDKESQEVLKTYKHQSFNQEKVSKEISVIHPVEEKPNLK